MEREGERGIEKEGLRGRRERVKGERYSKRDKEANRLTPMKRRIKSRLGDNKKNQNKKW